MRRRVEDDFDIVEVREHKLPCTFERPKATAPPKFEKPFLRMAIKPLIAFRAAELDAGANDLEREPSIAKFVSHGEPLDLCEICEITNSQTAGWLVTDISKQMSCGEIVSVELLVIWAFLLCHIDGATNGHDSHNVVD